MHDKFAFRSMNDEHKWHCELGVTEREIQCLEYQSRENFSNLNIRV